MKVTRGCRFSFHVTVVAAAIAYIYFSTVFVFIDQWLGLWSSPGMLNAVLFSAVALFCIFSYALAIYTDPGRVPSSFVPDVEDPENTVQEIKRKIHSKKRNKLVLSRLNDLVYIKYNRTLKRRYNARDIIDPILLDNIDEANEWLFGGPEDQEDELVYEEGDLNWGTAAMAAGVEDNIYGLRVRGSSSSSRSRSLDKGKGKGKATSSSQTRTLVDEESEEEEDDGEYNEIDVGLEDFENLEEE